MGEVVALPRRTPDIRCLTCGCKGQTFIQGEPEFLYCVECQHKVATANWHYLPEPLPAA